MQAFILLLCCVVYVGTGGGQCRFCGSTNNTGLLAIGTVCAEKECQERSKVVCTKTQLCGHPCNGVQGEEECLPCLYGCKAEVKDDDSEQVKSKLHHLKQDADDMCMICYTENLSCAPCIQVGIYTYLLSNHSFIIFLFIAGLRPCVPLSLLQSGADQEMVWTTNQFPFHVLLPLSSKQSVTSLYNAHLIVLCSECTHSTSQAEGCTRPGHCTV